MNLPTGTLTHLFTDIEGSSRLWEKHRGAMESALARHDAILRTTVQEHNGYLVKMRGDGIHAVFESAVDAVNAALSGQRGLFAESWDPAIGQLKVRMGMHSGTAELREGDYYSPTVNRAARVQEIGHGGQILLSQTAASLVRSQLAEGTTLIDLGRHTLKDVDEPENIFQLAAPDLPGEFPPLRATARTRTNLPSQMTSFIGREAELAEALRLLEHSRLLTLTGPGGTGKTRLSLKVAGDLLSKFRDGVWLVELASLTDESKIIPAIVRVFSLQSIPGLPLDEILLNFLRQKEMLLLLDNCEHLIENCAQLAREFLDAAPSLKILASSRESLGVPGESVLRVPSLKLPSTEETSAKSLMANEAANLLVERALAIRPDFRVTDENAPAIAEIVQRLDGIPLAIELAAARLRLFSPQQIASRLSDRFRLLTGGSRTALPRQQTLGSLIDWSYDLLTEEEKELFRRLSVFVGGWSIEAAEAIGDGLDVWELMDQLVNKSMVLAEDQGGRYRYRYLETIRQYARDRLFDAGEGEATRDRHFFYFTHLAGMMEDASGGLDQNIELYDREGDNFRSAIEWGLRRFPETAVDLIFEVGNIWIQSSGLQFSEFRNWIQVAKNQLKGLPSSTAEESRRKRAWARLYLNEGQSLMSMGDYPAVSANSIKAAEMARSLNDKPTLMAALGFYALVSIMTKREDQDMSKTYAAAQETLALANEMGNVFYKGMALNVLGGLEIERGNVEVGKGYWAEAKKGSFFLSAILQFQAAAMLIYEVGDQESAIPLLQESRSRFQKLGHAHFVATTSSEMAHIKRRTGDLAAAEEIYKETIVQFQWLGHRAAVAHELECLAFLAGRMGENQRAVCLLGAASALRERIRIEMNPFEHQEYDVEVAVLRKEMDGAAFEEAFNAGEAMSMDQAVAFALAESKV